MNDLSNKTFGYWKAIRPISQGKNKPVKWECECMLCNNLYLVPSSTLINGTSTKCRSCSTKLSKTKYSNQRIRHIFKEMKQRCCNTNHHSYLNYGGKGICICSEWLNNPLSFEEWSLSNGYADNLTIDRINLNGNYEPNNCRWVDVQTQNSNRSNCYYATINNETKTITEWCKCMNLKPQTIHTRIRNGISPLEALTKPINHKMNRK